jgi:hypothetical protein
MGSTAQSGRFLSGFGVAAVVWACSGEAGAVGPHEGFSVPQAYSDFLNGSAQWIVAGDFNGDGLDDVAGGDWNLAVHLSNGDGTFATESIDMPQPVRGLDAADVDGDGDLDLVACFLEGWNGEAEVFRVFLNDGAGGMSAGVVQPLGSFPEGIAVGDFNGDGFADAVVVERLSARVRTLYGNGAGAFSEALTVRTGMPGFAVATADFDRDGLDDIALTRSDTHTLVVLRSLGANQFEQVFESPVGVNPRGLTTIDFDGDGDQDLAATSADSDRLRFFLNFGGSFAVAGSTIAGDGPIGVTSADFNGDGAEDLAVAHLFGSSIRAFLNTGAGVFVGQAFVPTSGSSSMSDVVAGDFDGNGSPDVIVGRQSRGNVHLNLAPAPAPSAPSPSAPADGVKGLPEPRLARAWGEPIALRWEASSGFGVTYRVTISTSAGAGVVVHEESGLVGTSMEIPEGVLEAGGAYWWRVTAVNPTGETTSEARSFSLAGRTPDFTGDGVVDAADLAYLLARWGAGP